MKLRKCGFTCLGVVLAIIAFISVFSGCKKDGSHDKNDPNYPITISIFSMAAMQQPPADNKIYKWIKDNLHVTFNWDILVGEKDQKIGVMIAGQDYPDILQVDGPKFFEAGALIPLDDLIDKYAPRLKKHYAGTWEKMKEDDGHVYTLPVWGIQTGRDQGTWYGDSALWVQKQVLKEFGYPNVRTLDDYFYLLIKYKEKYPTINGQPTIAFTILTYDWHSFCMINPPNFLAGYPNDGRGIVDPVTHTYKVFLNQDISKRWFKKLNELNTIGVIDRSCFVDNYDQYLAKIASGRVLGFHDQAWQFQQARDALVTQDMNNRTHAPLPIVFDESITPHYRPRKSPNVGQGIGISIKAKDPERIIRFLDAQLSDEVQRIIGFWGIEGEDYQYDENGHPYRTAEQRKQQEDDPWKLHNQSKLWYNHAPKLEGSFSDGYPTNIADIYSERLATLKPEDVELWAAYNVHSDPELVDMDPPENPLWFPAWQLQDPTDPEAQLAWQRMESLYRRYLPRIILAAPTQFEALWAEYVSELDKAGIGIYEAYVQKELNKRIEKWSPKN